MTQHSPPEPRQHSKLPLAFFHHFLLVGSSTTLVLLVLFLSGMWEKVAVNNFRSLFSFSISKPQTDVSTVVVNQIRNASELTTTIFTMQTVVPTSQNRKIGDWQIGTTKLVYIAHGEVRAGVDLSQLTPENVKVTGEQVNIQLPPPQILDGKIDVDRSRVYSYDQGFLNLGPHVPNELQTLAQQKALSEVVSAACHTGILEQANKQAHSAIANLLNISGYPLVNVQTTAVEVENCVLSGRS